MFQDAEAVGVRPFTDWAYAGAVYVSVKLLPPTVCLLTVCRQVTVGRECLLACRAGEKLQRLIDGRVLDRVRNRVREEYSGHNLGPTTRADDRHPLGTVNSRVGEGTYLYRN